MMNLEELRRELDHIDHELVDLFHMRMNLVREVARYKQANNVPVFDPRREAEILERLAPAGVLGGYTRSFLNAILQLSKIYQKALLEGKEPDFSEKPEDPAR